MFAPQSLFSNWHIPICRVFSRVESCVRCARSAQQKRHLAWAANTMIWNQNKFFEYNDHTGKSLSEALIFASTNPQYDNRLFNELQVQTWGEHVAYRNCFLHSGQFLYTTRSPHILQKEEVLTKIYLYILVYCIIIYLPKSNLQKSDFSCKSVIPP